MVDSRLSARALVEKLGAWRTREPAYEALAEAVRVLCLDDRIAPRTSLPAERELAARLGVSRTTVAAAYRSLRESGHIRSVRGSGSETLPVGTRDVTPLGGAGDVLDLRQASPAPWPGLASVYAEVVGRGAGLFSGHGYEMLGSPSLREAIARRYTERGLPTDPAQIMVTNGAQSAIALCASLLVSRGARVLTETPTYPHAAEAFRRVGARLVGVPVAPGEGWDLDRAEHALRRASPVAAYLMPDFQNPTGESMPVAQRRALADAAAPTGTVLIVDETTAELDISGGAPATPFAADVGDAPGIVTLGSLGKTVWGGIRVGWVRADRETIQRLAVARPAADLGTPEVEQAVAERLVGMMPEIIAQRRAQLRAGRDALTAELRRVEGWQVPDVAGGVALWVGLGAARSSALVLAARRRGVLLSAGPRFSVGGGLERHLRVPFTGAPATLVRAAALLAEAWGEVAASRDAPAASTLVDALV